MSPRDLIQRLLERIPFRGVHELRGRHFRACFGTESGQWVAGQLARYCHAYTTTEGAPVDPRVLEGRRQVWLFINEYLGLQEGEVKRYAALVQGTEGDAIREDYEA